ncbi:MAG TPA: ABC transporter ATP-binding protein, partial [Marinobacter sp.]|nr:ABC transporter ATP-binding protein [Marinobacter sp.]
PMSTNETTLLELDNIGISFGGLRAVDQLNLEVKKGQVVGLIGPNGAGKTTVFNIITGVYKPTDGRVLWKGKEINGLPPYRVAERGIMRTFQTIRLFTGMSVLENVLAGKHLLTHQTWWAGLLSIPSQRREEKQLREECMEILKKLKLDDVAHEIATSLPYGIQRRVELARTLAASPELLILDEPAAGLNDNESAELNKTFSIFAIPVSPSYWSNTI